MPGLESPHQGLSRPMLPQPTTMPNQQKTIEAVSAAKGLLGVA